jgi:hypothetical protein
VFLVVKLLTASTIANVGMIASVIWTALLWLLGTLVALLVIGGLIDDWLSASTGNCPKCNSAIRYRSNEHSLDDSPVPLACPVCGQWLKERGGRLTTMTQSETDRRRAL